VCTSLVGRGSCRRKDRSDRAGFVRLTKLTKRGMNYLVHFSRAGLEALECLLSWFFGFEVYFEDLLLGSLVCYGSLAVDEVYGEAFWIFNCQ
jgi:hypothetical protein